jgi:hypothetical protein
MSAALLAKINEAIDAVHKALGAPGDYGYGTPKGDALFALYRLRFEFDALPARSRSPEVLSGNGPEKVEA